MKLEYIEKYPNLEDEFNIDKMLSMAREILPSMKLYKYRSGNYNSDSINYDLQNLNENKIRITNPSNLNDPFECNAVCKEIVDSLDKKLDEFEIIFELKKINKEEYIEKAHNELMKSHYEKFLADLLICSFSESNDNILMWSHYSNAHKGFCIEYDLEKLIKNKALILPVVYSVEMPDIDNIFLKNAKKYSSIYTKSSDWEYEKEWRFILNGNSEGENLRIDKPTAIYLGCNIDKRLEEDLIKICKDKEINCYKAKKDSYEYKLNFEEVLIN